MVQSHSNKLHHLEGNFCISSNVFRAQSRSIGLRVVKSQEVYCVVSTLHNTGPFNRSRKNLECFSTILCPDRTPCDNANTTRDVPIQFISSTLALNPHGEMDGWINGCTWPIHSSLEHPGMRQGLPLSSRILECVGRTRLDIFFLFLSFFPFVYFVVRTVLFSLLSPPCAIVPLERSLQVLEDLFTIWKYTFIFGESYRRAGRHVSTRTKPRYLALAFEIRYDKFFSIFRNLSAFRLKNKLKAQLYIQLFIYMILLL